MPIVAIIPAVFAVATAVYATTIFTVIAAVGATIAAVGALTKSRELMIAGGIIGAIGAIGGLASSAGLIGGDFFSSASSASGAAGDAASNAASAASGIDAEIAQWSSMGASAAGESGGAALSGGASLSGAPVDGMGNIVDQVAGTVTPLETGTAPALSVAEAPNIMPEAVVDNSVISMGDGQGGTLGSFDNPAATQGIVNTGVDVPTVAQPNTPGVGTPGAPGTVAASSTATSAPNPMDAGIPGSYDAAQKAASTYGAATGPVPTPNADPSTWDGIREFLKNNDRLLSGVVQAGSSFIAGATNGLTPAQIAALNAQAEANAAAANLSRTQQANMSQPLPTAWRTPVAAAPVTGAPAGMINRAPQPAVTGAA